MAMTVEDLREKLKGLPADAPVAVLFLPEKEGAILDVGSLFVSENAVPLVGFSTYAEDDIPF